MITSSRCNRIAHAAILLLFVFPFLFCSPVPLLQSCRTDGNAFTYATYTRLNEVMKYQLVDSSLPRTDVIANRFHGGIGFSTNRLELSGFAVPLILFDQWDLNFKVVIVDIGNPNALFRNLAVSSSLGSTGLFNISSDHSSLGAAFAFLIGTSGGILAQHLEINLMPSFSYNGDFSSEPAQIDTSFRRGTISFVRRDYSVALNILCRPSFCPDVELGIGLTYQQPYQRYIAVTDDIFRTETFTSDPISFQIRLATVLHPKTKLPGSQDEAPPIRPPQYATPTIPARIFLRDGESATVSVLDTAGTTVTILRNGNSVAVNKRQIDSLALPNDTIRFTNRHSH